MKVDEIEAALHSLPSVQLLFLKSAISKIVEERQNTIPKESKKLVALSDGHLSEIARLKAKYRTIQNPKLNQHVTSNNIWNSTSINICSSVSKNQCYIEEI